MSSLSGGRRRSVRRRRRRAAGGRACRRRAPRSAWPRAGAGGRSGVGQDAAERGFGALLDDRHPVGESGRALTGRSRPRRIAVDVRELHRFRACARCCSASVSGLWQCFISSDAALVARRWSLRVRACRLPCSWTMALEFGEPPLRISCRRWGLPFGMDGVRRGNTRKYSDPGASGQMRGRGKILFFPRWRRGHVRHGFQGPVWPPQFRSCLFRGTSTIKFSNWRRSSSSMPVPGYVGHELMVPEVGNYRSLEWLDHSPAAVLAAPRLACTRCRTSAAIARRSCCRAAARPSTSCARCTAGPTTAPAS
jgi:hypothetical protein